MTIAMGTLLSAGMFEISANRRLPIRASMRTGTLGCAPIRNHGSEPVSSHSWRCLLQPETGPLGSKAAVSKSGSDADQCTAVHPTGLIHLPAAICRSGVEAHSGAVAGSCEDCGSNKVR